MIIYPFRKKFLVGGIIIVSLVVVILVIYGWVIYGRKYKVADQKPITIVSPAPKVEIKHLAAGQISSAFPKDIIQEKNVQILQSFEADIEEGKRQQSTIRYLSAKSLQENFNLYKKYLTEKDWQIKNTLEQDNIKFLSANKNFFSLTIIVSPDQSKTQTIVDITLIGFPTLLVLPADFPTEGSVVLDEKHFISAQNKHQHQRKIIASKTLDENFEIYKKYLLRNNWAITETANDNEGGIKTLFAIRGKNDLTIVITNNPKTNENEILILLNGYLSID